MKTFKITSLHRVQSVRTCSIRIPGVIRKSGESQLQIDNFKWHLPLIYTHCLETIWRRFMRFNTLHHIHNMLQNCWRKSFLNTQSPGASGGQRAPRGPLPGLCPEPAGDLKQSPDPSPTFVPPNTKSWIRPWMVIYIYFSCKEILV